MRFYSYEDVKKINKGKYLICLLCSDKEDRYVGLAYGESYPIKIKNHDVLEYDFLVCILVRSVQGDYSIPVGISNEDEWTMQESEHQMEISKQKVKDKNIVSITRDFTEEQITYIEQLFEEYFKD